MKSTHWPTAAALVATLLAPAAARAQVAGASVHEAVRAESSARVVVSLRAPVPVETALEPLMEQVRALQDRVLLGLEPGDFVVTHRWDTIFALAGELSPAGLEKLLRDPEVDRIDVDVPGVMAASESVPLIRADELRGMGLSGAGVVVAVLDTGVDPNHPDLADRLVDQRCFCANADGSGCCPGGGKEASGAGAALDEQGHGTNVTGIIAGSGNVAPVGVAPQAQIVGIRVLDRNGAASGTAQVLSGLDYVMKSRPDVKVVNLSLVFNNFPGTCDSSASFTTAFAQAINQLKGRGTSVFASSGNNGLGNQIGLPACIANAIAVGAVYDGNVGTVTFGCTDGSTQADQATCFSNSSSAVDILAPGAAITSSGVGGGQSTFLGTSQAAPHAAGVAALLLQAKPGLSPDQILAALRNGGRPVTDPKNGLSIPRIDAKGALDASP